MIQQRCYSCLNLLRRTQTKYKNVPGPDASASSALTAPNRTLWNSWLSLRHICRPKPPSVSVQSSSRGTFTAFPRLEIKLRENGWLCGSVLAMDPSSDAPSGWLVLAAFFGFPTILWAYKVSHMYMWHPRQ